MYVLPKFGIARSPHLLEQGLIDAPLKFGPGKYVESPSSRSGPTRQVYRVFHKKTTPLIFYYIFAKLRTIFIKITQFVR